MAPVDKSALEINTIKILLIHDPLPNCSMADGEDGRVAKAMPITINGVNEKMAM